MDIHRQHEWLCQTAFMLPTAISGTSQHVIEHIIGAKVGTELVHFDSLLDPWHHLDFFIKGAPRFAAIS
jgi:hypothetical protein